MVKQGIKIYARVKPTKIKTAPYEIYNEEDSACVTFSVPKDLAEGFINNKKEEYKFRFSRVFDQQCTQDEIFDNVAKGVIDNVLEGYNGTVFAYGQTGSGKTFTITGGAERYSDRGLIPRILSYLFEYCEKNSETVYTIHISYLEIYNESGYDLLDPKHQASKLEDLPKVSLLEDSEGSFHLKNLSMHHASNEEEALNFLFLGDTNRMIAETPMNQASTRSHCVFTIHISSREPARATIKRAKLHLVDLAGSERVGKTGVGGILLKEAKYINLSLHYLEQVIVALSEKSRSHIPYRNSMLTSVLRDSLGGNCMTTMIATCAVDKKNLDESISTCKFAQRVAMIKNDALLNEEIDPKLMIAQLKREVQQLKAELAISTGQQYVDELTEEEIESLKRIVLSFIQDTEPDAVLSVGADMRKINMCFMLLKGYVLDKSKSSSRSESFREENGALDSSYLGHQTEVNKLKELIKQRDNEINILVSMLKKEKNRVAGMSSAREPQRSSSQPSAAMDSESERYSHRTGVKKSYSVDSTIQDREDLSSTDNEPSAYNRKLQEMSVGRKEAFEVFKRDYVHNDTVEDHKRSLKQRYADAKSCGEQVNASRLKINKLKTQIEQHRMRQSMQGLLDGAESDQIVDAEEAKLRQSMEEEKTRYKANFSSLRSMKTEIEHLQHLLEKAKVQMQKDFELWWAEQAALHTTDVICA
ncbi:kinesin-like protein KIF6 isoform X2 [Actinia tenebrosa]|uniref:Kinesin-like protein n=1 Tax=Actinia tenebrosa TaxID=6105 RepID=A0A6P8IF48_ACTTE|nr:kinesin-like protein KIF6 isoform X2 [Actinia tenebrosa]